MVDLHQLVTKIFSNKRNIQFEYMVDIILLKTHFDV